MKTKKKKRLSQIMTKLNPDLPPAITTAFEGAFEGLTGIIKSSPRDLTISWLNVAQRVIRGQKLASINAEFERLQNNGKIPKEYLTSLQGQYTLVELLDFLENRQVDEQVFQVLKKIFLIAATQKEDIIGQQYMRIAKDLTGGEVIVLLTAYRISTDSTLSNYRFATGSVTEDKWGNVIAGVSGLEYSEIVITYAIKLSEKKMLHPLQTPSAEGNITYMGKHMRLTNLGFGFCDYISKYENIIKD